MPKTKRKKIYKFTHLQDDFILTNITGREFSCDWLGVERDGKITVRGTHYHGYAWDGCSPKWFCCGKIWGTPDGKPDPRTGKPLTYYASMFHDALYQFKQTVNISRKESDILFHLLLKEAGFRFHWLYMAGVRIGGAFYGKWKVKKTQGGIQITGYSWL
jgi:hypothetical protein